MPRICGDVTLAAHVPVIVLPEASAFKEIGVSTRLAPLANPESVPVSPMMSPLPPIAPNTVPLSVLPASGLGHRAGDGESGLGQGQRPPFGDTQTLGAITCRSKTGQVGARENVGGAGPGAGVDGHDLDRQRRTGPAVRGPGDRGDAIGETGCRSAGIDRQDTLIARRPGDRIGRRRRERVNLRLTDLQRGGRRADRGGRSRRRGDRVRRVGVVHPLAASNARTAEILKM